MNSRSLILIVIAFAILAAMGMIIKNRGAGKEPAGIKVLAASTDIPAGSFVRSDKQLAWVDWPKNNVLPSYILQDKQKIEDFNGAVAKRIINAGEPITLAAVVRAKDGGFMSAVLEPGKRAVSLAVTITSGNAGFIFPGDKVDLILTHKINGEVLASETFLENLRILAIDQMLSNLDNKAVVAKTVTIEVTPKQAEMVNVATGLGSISLSLRSLAANPANDNIAKSPENGDGNYSTNNDVSRLMDGGVSKKVNVYRGNSPAEQLEFREDKK